LSRVSRQSAHSNACAPTRKSATTRLGGNVLRLFASRHIFAAFVAAEAGIGEYETASFSIADRNAFASPNAAPVSAHTTSQTMTSPSLNARVNASKDTRRYCGSSKNTLKKTLVSTAVTTVRTPVTRLRVHLSCARQQCTRQIEQEDFPSPFSHNGTCDATSPNSQLFSIAALPVS